jgi:membrane protein
LLLIVITMCSIFFGRDAVEGKIYAQLQGFVGHDTALQLQQIIKNAAISGKNTVATVIGIVALVIGATSVFGEMQDSINMIWGVKAKPKKGWLKMLQNRLLSFSVIISLGFLLLVSLLISTLVEGFSNHLRGMFPGITVIFFYVLNVLITAGVTGVIFAVIFKVLPDAKITWKDVMAGAITTTFLFLLGKFGISFYIAKSNIGSTYGPAGSLVVLLLWIYYSAMILYFGAEFTKAYAIEYGAEIHPSEYAVTVEQVEVEKGNGPVQAKTKK